jgi:hypothetical protein
MGFVQRARASLRRWRDSATGRAALDGLLSRATATDPLEARLWLAAVVAWVGRPTSLDAALAPTARVTLDEADALELLCETGLAREPSFLGEALATAVRAQGVRAPERSLLRAAFWSWLRRRPADLVVPENASSG